MPTEKQLLANQQNAQLSTGPKTAQGKITIATNAIKHGIFTKDLLISTTLGKENEAEYLEMLSNLLDCLSPQNQMEGLLVEKIAIDFWRLRRIIRFEAGSIGQYLDSIFKEYYSQNKNKEKIDAELKYSRAYIAWILSYIDCLKREEVDFDQPIWKGDNIESIIFEDFCILIKNIDSLSYEEKKDLIYGDSNFATLKTILAQYGYSSKKEISAKLIEAYEWEIRRLEQEIEKLEQMQYSNIEADTLNSKIGSFPLKSIPTKS